MISGYYSAAYARSFEPAQQTCQLGGSGGWLMRRPVAGTTRHDLAGLYPFLCCQNWEHIPDDLKALPDDPVSVVAATDPFGRYTAALLENAFDFARPFKDHYVIDTSVPLRLHIKASHRETAARALRRVEVTTVETPAAFADDWVRLYGVLCDRHGIAGIRRFSDAALKAQLDVPGLVMFRAAAEGRTIGLDLWYLQDDCAQGHLAAFDDEGYRLRASYATKFFLIEYFRSRAAWINLGGGAATGDGLAQFKSGFASGTKPSWICGRIFDRRAYDERVAVKRVDKGTTFFPAYRDGEIF